MAAIVETFALALRHFQAGSFYQAEQLFRQILQVDSAHAEAWCYLGAACHAQGALAEAENHYRQTVQVMPSHPIAYNCLGIVLYEQGKFALAVPSFQQASRWNPGNAEIHNNLGAALCQSGNAAEAIASHQQALRLKPGYAEAHYNLGLALRMQGRDQAAIEQFQQALRFKPSYPEALNDLGTALAATGNALQAIHCYRQALGMRPDFAAAHYNLGVALQNLSKFDEAAACYRQALTLQPSHFDARNNLGNTLMSLGQLNDAMGCFRQALQLNPDQARLHSNLLYTMHFCSDADACTIRREHDRWNQQHAQPLAKLIKSHANDHLSPLQRRLRIGYVSPDFHWHPVGRFILPLLETHDRAGFEVFCYASQNVEDAVTAACRAQADVWRAVGNLTDEQLAEQIRHDRIDILVDLTMHMSNNRMLMFARKPAPVQVTYLAYCSTTGLGTMDYRLTDPYLDPPGTDERIYSERTIYLPETYWCYRQADDAPDGGPLPALENRCVTFGCLNNSAKVTPPTLKAWSILLKALPTARLLLHAHPGSHRKRVRDFFVHHEISADRVTFVDYLPSLDYFRVHHRIDICLDPYPYAGGTTTCDALWMGVPVVSLAGNRAVGRGGLSILSNIGLKDLVANSPEQYIDIAVQLARDLPRLTLLRSSLRERMRQSPLMDAPRLTRHVEAAYRGMWQRRCCRKRWRHDKHR